ncbi:unnamed protein product [Phytophthora lilii]|uniref:Unnamed protein product n=1 Tax=Phytophthora lilii TaxID=2077276 RepID=A0A9W6XJJ9_9STRA|nr:unnamed protein product [Phytophthora lilii]
MGRLTSKRVFVQSEGAKIWPESCNSNVICDLSFAVPPFQLHVVALVLRQHPTIAASLPPVANATCDESCRRARRCGHGGFEVPSEVVTAAVTKGHFMVLKFLLDNDAGRECNHEVKDVILMEEQWKDSVPVMPAGWNGPSNAVRWGGRAILEATRAQFDSIAKWLCDNTPHQSDQEEMWEIIELAVNNGAVEFAEAIMPPNRKVLHYWHSDASLSAIKWMLDAGHGEHLRNNQDCASGVCRSVSKSGDLELTQPKGGSVEVVDFLFKKGFTDESATAMVNAAEQGHLHCMKWLLEHTSEYSYLNSATAAIEKAATNGYLEVL